MSRACVAALIMLAASALPVQAQAQASSAPAARPPATTPATTPTTTPTTTPAAARPAPPRPASAETGLTWAELTPPQQAALAPLRQHWSGIDGNRKYKWVQVAQRFPGMPAEERQRVQARMAEWASMTPSERGRARQNFQELRNLPTQDRHALWEAYRALPDDQRRELAQRARPAARAAEAAASGSPSAAGTQVPSGTPAPAGGPGAATATAKAKVPINPGPVAVKPVTPTVLQARPGATTTLVTKTPTPPAHNQPGLPKITASDGFVNRSTLLPRRGPQGAATHAAVPASAAGADDDHP